VKPRPRNPILPGTRTDRTATAGIRRRAAAEIRRRYAGLQAEVLAIFGRIRFYALNDALRPVAYAITPDEMAAVNQMLKDALERWIISGRDVANNFWWTVYDAEAALLGTAQSAANLTALSAAYAGARSLEAVVFSEPYRTRVAMAQIKSYEHWTGASAQMKADLSQEIGRAIVDGKNPRAVVKTLMERLDVSKSRAMQYAQTDITDTLRQARMAEMEAAQEDFGLKIGLLWTSALIPTTRPWHASRNGQVYTAQEVRTFYSERGNIFRCHCSITEALLDENDKPILSQAARYTFGKELAAWRKTYGGK
jgi:uncharacterized protein with gpF-like domain